MSAPYITLRYAFRYLWQHLPLWEGIHRVWFVPQIECAWPSLSSTTNFNGILLLFATADRLLSSPMGRKEIKSEFFPIGVCATIFKKCRRLRPRFCRQSVFLELLVRLLRVVLIDDLGFKTRFKFNTSTHTFVSRLLYDLLAG
jgi:hypothetical protein